MYKSTAVLNNRSDEKKRLNSYETDLPTALICQLPSELFAGSRDSDSAAHRNDKANFHAEIYFQMLMSRKHGGTT